jgi:hypothetical protein
MSRCRLRHPGTRSSGPHISESVSDIHLFTMYLNSVLTPLVVPAVLVETLGAAIYSGTQDNAAWKQSYAEYGVGGPLKMALEPAGGFGKFLLVLAALSAIPVRLQRTLSWTTTIFANGLHRTISPITIRLPCTHRTSGRGRFAFPASC